MANFRCERLFVMLDEPVPGVDHLKAVDAVEFAWHGSDDNTRQLGLTPLGEFTFAPFERPRWFPAGGGLDTVRGLLILYQGWLDRGNNPYGYRESLLMKKIALFRQVEQVLAAADACGRCFYLAARDLG